MFYLKRNAGEPLRPGAERGVIGAAVASAMSYVWGGIHITWRLWHHPLVSPKGMSLKPDISILRPCVKNDVLLPIEVALMTISGTALFFSGMMMGVGKTKAPFLYNITGMWRVRIVVAMLCIRFLGMGLVSAWACMIAHNMLLFCLYLGTFVRGGWNPLNVEGS